MTSAREASTTGRPGAAALRATAGAPVLLQGIGKRFGSVVAVEKLDLAIEAGEFITFLGPSGSGKTTTLMIIAGFDQPDRGEIYIGSEPMVRVPPYRRGIGMVFQNYALFPHLTVAENIGFPLRQRGIAKPEIAARLAETLEIVRLTGYDGRYPRQLSGGQQQRVALARAIIFKPRVLLMDEPLSALDKQLREELQFEIKRLHSELGITFVYVTHDQREALIMSDRIAVMNGGRLEQLGTPADLYDRPANRFVATFIGESNLLEGRVSTISAGAVTVRVGDATLGAVCQGDPQVGSPVLLAVRPEKIVFAEPGRMNSSAEINTISVQVRDVIFVGEVHRYLLEIAPGSSLVMKQPHRFGVAVPAPGERALIQWCVEDTLVV